MEAIKQETLLLEINEKPKHKGQWILLSLQHVFAMFSATILVPLLTGLDVGVGLVASGVGTLIYIAATKGKVPVYLGSSFAYIAAIMVAAASSGFPSAYVGLMTVGIVYVIVATIIRFVGSAWLDRLLPPVVIGPIIMIIGLSLAYVAIGNSGLDGSLSFTDPVDGTNTLGLFVPLIALATFVTVALVALKARGFVKMVPFVIAITVGYVLSVAVGLVNLGDVFSGVRIIQVPAFTFLGTYRLDFSAVLMFLPIAFVTMAEHIGDHSVLGTITNKDFFKDPGLDKTLLGDGLATFVSAAMGGPANTTYGENTGVVAMTRVGSVYVIGLAAIFAIILGFIGPVQALIGSIPGAVIGGITIVLYGLIAANGVKVLIKAKVNIAQMRNLIIISSILVIGLGGALIPINEAVSLQGMALATIVGIILNLVLPKEEESRA